jgi:uncharacterized protein (TIGR03067 family)
MNRYVVTALVAGLLHGAAPAPQDDAKKDKEALQGTWRPVSSEQEGEDTLAAAKQYTFTFDKDTFTVKRDDQLILKGTFKVDPSKSPKAIDMTITEGRRDDEKGQEAHGIYEFTQDGLKWCTSEPGRKEHPKEFATKKGSNDLYVTLKKETK